MEQQLNRRREPYQCSVRLRLALFSLLLEVGSHSRDRAQVLPVPESCGMRACLVLKKSNEVEVFWYYTGIIVLLLSYVVPGSRESSHP